MIDFVIENFPTILQFLILVILVAAFFRLRDDISYLERNQKWHGDQICKISKKAERNQKNIARLIEKKIGEGEG